jgi:gamma-glutamyltranspeptidase/glutathione hydrolase
MIGSFVRPERGRPGRPSPPERGRPGRLSRALALLAFALAASPVPADEPAQPMLDPRSGYTRPAGIPHQSRSAVIATHGIVATSQPLAAQAGLEVLQAGGSAADAAIAANAVIGLVEPMSCGLGGDLFAIYWDAKTQKLYGLNASGRSPARLTRAVFAEKGLTEIPEYGPLTWSVPGCVSGWAELHGRFGRLDWAELLEPAIDYAEQGFPISEIIADGWAGAEKLLSKWPDSVATYVPGGHAPKTGQIFKNPRLAKSLRAIAEGGPAAFYSGPIARAIVAFSEKSGGYFSLEDFSGHNAEWVDPVSTNYRGYDVWELPPNGQGIAALEMLNLLEPHDLRKLGPAHPDYLHLVVEAKKLTFADRARWYADPAFGPVPVAELISKDYAARRAKLIDPQRAATHVPPGDPKLAHGDTIYLTVVDSERNCCSLIQSNYYGFGSQVVPGELGFALQNRGNLFSLDESHPNRLEPKKRPFHTIIPAMVTQEGRPWLCFGVMGGDMQPQGHVQVLVNLIDFGLNVQAAGDAARIRHDGSATPTGKAELEGGGLVLVEAGIPPATRAELERRGHKLKEADGGAFGGYQAILIDWSQGENGVLHGGTDPRKDGAAVGW